MTERQVVTVDGLAGSGKTTLARLLAERLGFCHLNSGLLYRALAFLARASSCDPSDCARLVSLIESHHIVLISPPGCVNPEAPRSAAATVLIDGVDRTAELQTPEISDLTSRASVHGEVRERLVGHQRDAFAGYGLVAEGRDMGTVIFPEAVAKFFIEANEDVRVARRLDQFRAQGIDLNAPADPQALKRNVEIEIRDRDKRDRERAIAPTKPAQDALIVDNSQQTLTLVVDNLYSLALSKGVRPAKG